jgi:hypothetical protein
MPLMARSRTALPAQPDGARSGGASAAEASEPLFAWGRAHGLGAN